MLPQVLCDHADGSERKDSCQRKDSRTVITRLWDRMLRSDGGGIRVGQVKPYRHYIV